MRVGINCGHTVSGPSSGTNGLIAESEHTRRVGHALMELLKERGIEVVDCTVDQAQSQKQYLMEVAAANNQELDWFISIHFNASMMHTGQGVEVCFCDNQEDVDTYGRAGGEDAAAKAIADGICNCGEADNLPFEEYVGQIAQKDWAKRRIMLPSVVAAQAIKESARGTSELAQKANALFGIKKNGWTGRIYIKEAVEQREDGSYYTVDQTQWRAYESWEQSILDHNDYIATRRMEGGRRLRYEPVIGCENYVLACQHLQECGYATALNYAESLINDYIEKYNLIRFDNP